MRKRIRLHQVRVGMYVEELEGGQPSQWHGLGPILSPGDIDRMMNTHALSVIIDTHKGLDVADNGVALRPLDQSAFEANLRAVFSEEQIGSARRAIKATRPAVCGLLADAQNRGLLHLDAAHQAVVQVMAEARSNAGAMIAVAKLKDKDEGTFLHSLAVSALMVTFGRNLGLDEARVRLLGLGGLVHDLGKMALPAEVLTKPGKLTADELAIVRTHAERGYEMVKQIEDMPKPVLDICLYHHEKFDGSGYPRGLAGTEIPSVARIAAICDVYDALTTVRPYKRAWSQAEAIDTMLRSAGHFDPGLLKAFISKMVLTGTLH